MKTVSINGGKRTKKVLKRQLLKGYRELLIRICVEGKKDIILYYQIKKEIDFSRFCGIHYFLAKRARGNEWMFLPDKYEIESTDQKLLDFQDFILSLTEEEDFFAYEVSQ